MSFRLVVSSSLGRGLRRRAPLRGMSSSVLSSFPRASSALASRAYSAAAAAAEEEELEPREAMEYDVVIVGAGPAGLASAIRLKQLEAERGNEISVCVVEKAAEVGAHILSGNVFEPRALDELIPDWREQGALGDDPTEVKEDHFLYLRNEKDSLSVPNFLLPPTLHNEGNYIISLGKLVRWLGEQAEGMGVEIYPGFPADEVLYSDSGAVVGVATKDMGIGKDGRQRYVHAWHGAARSRPFSLKARGDRAAKTSSPTLTCARIARCRATVSASRKCGRSRRRKHAPDSFSTHSRGRCRTPTTADRFCTT